MELNTGVIESIVRDLPPHHQEFFGLFLMIGLSVFTKILYLKMTMCGKGILRDLPPHQHEFFGLFLKIGWSTVTRISCLLPRGQ